MTQVQMYSPVRTLKKNKRFGGAIIEAVLVLMMLSNLAFGIVEFGWYFYVRHSFEGAAREGARAGIVSGAANTDVTNAVTEYINAAGLNNSGYAVKVESPLGTACTVGTLTAGTAYFVTVYSTWSVAGAGFRPLSLIGGSKVVSGVTAMRIE